MSENIHNIAIAGHGSCGKTTLVEELLVRAKAIPRGGKVDEGTSVLDYDPEERDRKFTIDSKVCHLERDGQFIQLIDTPGYPDFIGAVVDAFSVVETAVIAVDAVGGIKVNTRRVWDEATAGNLARMIVITRLDADNARYDELVEEIRETFGNSCIPLFIPDAAGSGLSKVENTYRLKSDSSSRAQEFHAQLVESVVEVDEELMVRYLAEEEISDEEIDHAFARALVEGSIVPILCNSVVKNVGVEQTLNTLASITPTADAPIPRKMVDEEGNPIEKIPVGSSGDSLLAEVFKVVADPFVGKLSYLRVFSGVLEANMQVQNITRHAKEKVTTLLRMQAKEQAGIQKAEPGDIVAVPKMEDLSIGDTIGDAKVGARFVPAQHPKPMVKVAVEPKSRNDESKIGESLHKLQEGDLTVDVHREPATRELIMAGLSTLHLDVVLSRLKRRYQLEVETRTPKTPYRESITGSAEAHHKHKKQTGGRGQFGEVYIKLEPAEEGTVLEFVDKIVGGVIPNQFIPAVEKGIRETMESGILAGFPIEGCRVTLYDGSYHTVDSSEAAFKTAGREAFKKAFLDAKPCLKEPIVNIEIHIPSKYMGDITGDLNSRRGRITGMDTIGDMQIIRAIVPDAEIKSYSTELRSLTGGEGSYTVTFSHYEPVPANVQQQVIAQVKREEEAK